MTTQKTLRIGIELGQAKSDLDSLNAHFDKLRSGVTQFDASQKKAFQSLRQEYNKTERLLRPIKLKVTYDGLAGQFRAFQRHLVSHLRETQRIVDANAVKLRATSAAAAAAAVAPAVSPAQKAQMASAVVMPQNYRDPASGRFVSKAQYDALEQKRLADIAYERMATQIAGNESGRRQTQMYMPFGTQSTGVAFHHDPKDKLTAEPPKPLLRSEIDSAFARHTGPSQTAQNIVQGSLYQPRSIAPKADMDIVQKATGDYFEQFYPSRQPVTPPSDIDLAERKYLDRVGNTLPPRKAPETKRDSLFQKALEDVYEDFYPKNAKPVASPNTADIAQRDYIERFNQRAQGQRPGSGIGSWEQPGWKTAEQEWSQWATRQSQQQAWQAGPVRSTGPSATSAQASVKQAIEGFDGELAKRVDTAKKWFYGSGGKSGYQFATTDQLVGLRKDMSSRQWALNFEHGRMKDTTSEAGRAHAKVLKDEIGLLDTKQALLKKTLDSRGYKEVLLGEEKILENYGKQVKMAKERERLLEKSKILSESAKKSGDYTNYKQAQELYKKVERFQPMGTDPGSVESEKAMKRQAEALGRYHRDLNKTEKAFKKARMSGTAFSRTLTKLSIGMTGFAATFFVAQQLGQIFSAAIRPTMDLNEAVADLNKNLSLTKGELDSSKAAISSIQDTGIMTAGKAGETIAKYQQSGLSNYWATQAALQDVYTEQQKYKKVDPNAELTLNEAVDNFSSSVIRLAKKIGETDGPLAKLINKLGMIVEPDTLIDKELQFRRLGENIRQEEEAIRPHRNYTEEENKAWRATVEKRVKDAETVFLREEGYENKDAFTDAYSKYLVAQPGMQDPKLIGQKKAEVAESLNRKNRTRTMRMQYNSLMDAWDMSGEDRAITTQVQKIKKQINGMINAVNLLGKPLFSSEEINNLATIRDKQISDLLARQAEAQQAKALAAYKKYLQNIAKAWSGEDLDTYLSNAFKKADTPDKKIALDQIAGNLSNRLFNWQASFDNLQAEDKWEKELASIGKQRNLAEMQFGTLDKALPNITGSDETLRVIYDKKESDVKVDKALEDFFGELDEKSKKTSRALSSWQSFYEALEITGPGGENFRQIKSLTRMRNELAKKAGSGFMDSPYGEDTRTPNEIIQSEIERLEPYKTEYQKIFEPMGDKQKNVYEQGEHFWEMGKASMADYANEASKTASKFYEAFDRAFKGLEDTLVEFVMTGKFEFNSLAQSIIADLTRIVIQSQIVGPLGGLLSGKGSGSDNLVSSIVGLLGSGKSSGGASVIDWGFHVAEELFGGFAKGGVKSGPGIQSYENKIVSTPTYFAKGGLPGINEFTNQIVKTPTYFGTETMLSENKFARGVNLMGEAGAEAIMPLTRTPSGNLGVEAVGLGSGGIGIKQEINIIEAPGVQARVEKSDDGMSMNIIIEKVEGAVASRLSRGTGLAPILDSRYHKIR